MKSVDHKCINCNAVLKYNPKGKNWKCEYCGSTFNKSDLTKNEEKYKEAKVKEDVKAPEIEMDEYTCQNCGAKIVADSNTSATFCVYCRNTAILKSRLTDKFEPNRIIPFTKTKEDAIEGFKKICKGKLFIPNEFALERNINEIKGVYIPFWLHSYDMHVHLTGTGNNIQTWTVGNTVFTKTEVYNIDREADYSFESVPVDGSKRFDDAIMNSVEPFDYVELTEFSPSYLSGFFAEKYDVEEPDADRIAYDRSSKTSFSALTKSIRHQSFVPSTKEITCKNKEHEYVLLPVWMVNVKYNGKMYPFAMNGQTGKMIGDIPYSKGKAFKWFMIIFIITFVVLMLITFIL